MNEAALKAYGDAIATINESLAPPSFLEFVENGFPLTEDDRFTHFDITLAPWFRNLAQWIEDPETDWIYLVQGSQTAKTTFLMAVLLYFSQYAQGSCPMFWASPTESEAGVFIKDRLRPFLQQSIGEDYGIDPKKWKMAAFRVYNSFVKVGYASALATMRSWPARILLGDEIAIWKTPVEYFHKRARTFKNQKKGVFGTTPPFDAGHPSWQTILAANWYHLHVPCPHCCKKQYMAFKNIRWYTRADLDEVWDYEKVRNTAVYHCEYCDQPWDESRKMDFIARGTLVCVDTSTGEPAKETGSRARTFQLPATYSPFMSWGEMAVNFLENKASGVNALNTFITDELAETPKEESDKEIHPSLFAKFIDGNRNRGFQQGYDLYTVGVDVQGVGALFVSLMGFKSGNGRYSAHLLDYACLEWRDSLGVANFSSLLEWCLPIKNYLYGVFIDSTDGVVRGDLEDFCYAHGHPFYNVIDAGHVPVAKVRWQKKSGGRLSSKLKPFSFVTINSAQVKNDILSGFDRDPAEADAWTFPNNTENIYFQHMSNEKRTAGTDGRGRIVYRWVPRYARAEQHYFSSYVYAVAGVEDRREELCRGTLTNRKRGQRTMRSSGVNAWQ